MSKVAVSSVSACVAGRSSRRVASSHTGRVFKREKGLGKRNRGMASNAKTDASDGEERVFRCVEGKREGRGGRGGGEGEKQEGDTCVLDLVHTYIHTHTHTQGCVPRRRLREKKRS